ncbi:hypothetical protein N7447_011374 [Penicillium robsamsonii]|uniref:uncharacterized protein n=1 Tax=Penicillium robsamsonii TaxID=1792511 RepID=UPI00254982EF|nr:uncharacterized protein N7447_011374 [Penicillium robsamsonii]KAJ5807141.1 hypothetical protein N7447_011374 [Penicillium robsamsonii]
MVAASRRTSALGEITHRSGASGHPATPDPPPHTILPAFLEGAALWDPPFAGVVHGVWTLHPRATCRSLPAPSRAPGRITCVRTGAEEFSGGNWMVSASPRYAGGAAATGRLVRPFHLTTFYPFGGLGSRDSLAARRVGPRDVLP